MRKVSVLFIPSWSGCTILEVDACHTRVKIVLPLSCKVAVQAAFVAEPQSRDRRVESSCVWVVWCVHWPLCTKLEV